MTIGSDTTTGGLRVPRLSFRAAEAAEALGVSKRHFERHVAPDLPVVYTGSARLYRVADLEAWLERRAR